MRSIFIAALVTSTTVLVAAPGQRTTPYPGQMTDARVWVQNRGSSEAIPIDVRGVNIERPLKVEVVNGQTFEQYARDPVNVRFTRTQWEYRTIVLNDPAEAARLLNAEGQAGWETTGVGLVNPSGTTVILKRMK